MDEEELLTGLLRRALQASGFVRFGLDTAGVGGPLERRWVISAKTSEWALELDGGNWAQFWTIRTPSGQSEIRNSRGGAGVGG